METSAHIKYLLANEQDNRWGVVVTTTGYQIIEPQTSYPPSNHPVRYLFSVEKGRLLNEYQLIYISRGDGQFVISDPRDVGEITAALRRKGLQPVMNDYVRV